MSEGIAGATTFSYSLVLPDGAALLFLLTEPCWREQVRKVKQHPMNLMKTVTVGRAVEHWLVITKSMAAFQKCCGTPLELCISTKQITTLKRF